MRLSPVKFGPDLIEIQQYLEKSSKISTISSEISTRSSQTNFNWHLTDTQRDPICPNPGFFLIGCRCHSWGLEVIRSSLGWDQIQPLDSPFMGGEQQWWVRLAIGWISRGILVILDILGVFWSFSCI